MTPEELKRKLKKEGWEFEEGSRHCLATNSKKPGVQISIPRHNGKDIAKGTLVEQILKAAGLK